jgi:hypothetical protein
MRITVAIAIFVVATSVAAIGGYWAGFREAWSMGIRADAAPRGALALAQLNLIQSGRIDDVKPMLEHDIDMGLILWHDLSKSSVGPLVNTLSGVEVIPDYEQYVRRLALYRSTHRSSLHDPESIKSLIDGAAKLNPSVAEEITAGSNNARRALDETVSKYAN